MFAICKKNVNPTKKCFKNEFNKLFNDPIKGYSKDIRYMVDYINRCENPTKKPIDFDIKNESIAYCDVLPFGILSYSSYIDINTVEIIYSVAEENKYKILGTKSVKMAKAFRKLKIHLFIGFLKILRDNNKIHISDIMLEEELLKYMRSKR